MALTCEKCGQRVEQATVVSPEPLTGDARRRVKPAVYRIKPCGHTGAISGTPESPSYPPR